MDRVSARMKRNRRSVRMVRMPLTGTLRRADEVARWRPGEGAPGARFRIGHRQRPLDAQQNRGRTPQAPRLFARTPRPRLPEIPSRRFRHPCATSSTASKSMAKSSASSCGSREPDRFAERYACQPAQSAPTVGRSASRRSSGVRSVPIGRARLTHSPRRHATRPAH